MIKMEKHDVTWIKFRRKLTALEELYEDVGVPFHPFVLGRRHLRYCLVPVHANLGTETSGPVEPAKPV